VTLTRSQMKKLVYQYFDECSEKYFPDYAGKFEKPKFSFQKSQSLSSVAYYSCKIFDNKELKDQIFFFNKNVDFSLELLRSVVFHETIHYYDTNIDINAFYNEVNNDEKEYKEHNDFFMKYMDIINSVEGPGYIAIEVRKDISLRDYYYIVELQNEEESVYARIDELEENLIHTIMESGNGIYNTLLIYETNSFVMQMLRKITTSLKYFRYAYVDEHVEFSAMLEVVKKTPPLMKVELDHEKCNEHKTDEHKADDRETSEKS